MIGLMGSYATTASFSPRCTLSAAIWATNVLLPAPGEPVMPITVVGRRRGASAGARPSVAREMDRAKAAFPSYWATRGLTAERTVSTNSSMLVPVWKIFAPPHQAWFARLLGE